MNERMRIVKKTIRSAGSFLLERFGREIEGGVEEKKATDFVTEVDRESGLVQASSLRRQSLFGPADDWRGESDPMVKETRERSALLHKHGLPFAFWTRWNELTARIEPWHRNSVRVRLSIVKHGTLPSSYR